MRGRLVRWGIWGAVAVLGLLTIRWWWIGLLWMAVPGGILGTVLVLAALFSPWGAFRGEDQGQ